MAATATERRAIDYAWTHPNPTAIPDGGYEGVARYLSTDPSKDLTADEAAALHAAALWILCVYESTAVRASQGYAAGVADAKAANAHADQLGYPTDAPLFYAVDFDATPRQVRTYFAGARHASKRPVGIYGGRKVIDATRPLAHWFWQTEAWSVGVSPRAHLYQRVHPVGHIAGTPTGWDEDVICRPELVDVAWHGTAHHHRHRHHQAPAPTRHRRGRGPAVHAARLAIADAIAAVDKITGGRRRKKAAAAALASLHAADTDLGGLPKLPPKQ